MLEINNLSKKVNNKYLFNSISMTFQKNKIYYLKGSVGRGKTTFLKMLANLDQDYTGKITLAKVDIKSINNFFLKHVSFVHQDLKLYEELTVLENIKIINNFIINKKKLLLYAKTLKINKLLNKKCKYLSGGEKQRVAILANLIKDRLIFLLDEPFSFLDSDNYLLVMKLLKKQCLNKIIIITSHLELPISFYDYAFELDFNQEVPVNSIKTNNVLKDNLSINHLKPYKKISKTTNFYRTIFTFIITLNLFFIGLNKILFSYLERANNHLLFSDNQDNSLCLKQNHVEYDFDLSSYFEDIEYYETLNTDNIDNFTINKIHFDNTLLPNTTFVLNNIFYPLNNKILLILPSSYYKENMIQEGHVLNITYNDKHKFIINIDKVYFNDTNSFQLLANNIDYLKNVINVDSLKINHLYSDEAEKLYPKLLNDKSLTNYSFYKNGSFITYFKLDYSRITFNDLKKFINQYNFNIDYYLYSDNINLYIDYTSKNIYPIAIKRLTFNNLSISFDYETNYLLYEYKPLENNQIIISQKIANELNIKVNDDITLSFGLEKRQFTVIEIEKNLLTAKVFLNKSHLNTELSDNLSIYNVFVKLKNQTTISSTDFIVNQETLSFPKLSYLLFLESMFLNVSRILSLIGFFSLLLGFELLILKKEKNKMIAKHMGYNLSFFNKLDYFDILILSLKSSILAIFYMFLTSIVLTIMINGIYHINLAIYIDLLFYLKLLIANIIYVNILFYISKRINHQY